MTGADAHIYLPVAGRTLDPSLLTAMRDIERRLQGEDQLDVRLIEAANILPAATAFFTEALPQARGSAQTRAAERMAWFEQARKALTNCNLVFIDPDNGLQPRSVPLTSPLAGKYATVEEIAALLDTAAGVVLYQHGNRMAWPAQREDVCSAILAGHGQGGHHSYAAVRCIWRPGLLLYHHQPQNGRGRQPRDGSAQTTYRRMG